MSRLNKIVRIQSSVFQHLTDFKPVVNLFPCDVIDKDNHFTIDFTGVRVVFIGGDKLAKMLKKKIGADKVDMFCVNDIQAGKLLDYKNLILVCSSLGRSTWEREQRDRWAKFFPGMRKISLKDRFVALVGLGDHVTYPKNFVDGMGYMAELVTGLGGTLVGKTSTDGYVYEDSTAVIDDLFVGLPLDEDFEPEKTDARISKWLDMVLPEFERI